ncbi:MAG: hypothetical protein C0490_01590 [Marivirga sp.]|nr:hypothetical protein [Marivirga sp.]
MRLGQLARRLALRPGEIVEFLARNNIHIDEGTNTRLDDAYVKLIQDRYAPDLNAVTTTLSPEEITQQAPVEAEHIVQETVEAGELKVEAYQEKTGQEEEKTELEEGVSDVIKAPKVSLSGLKVLGKIELPEPKKKDPLPELTTEQPEVLQDEKKPREEIRTNFNQKRNRPQQRQAKNPIALQREKEAQEEQKQRQEKADREKEKRKQNYYKKVKMSPPTKAAKLVEEPTMQMSAEELAEPPKTWLGKLIKWLTT